MIKKAYLAGGCFWCMYPPFSQLEGVIDVVAGYSGGDDKNPSYREVAYGHTDHRETAEISYNPDIVSYKKLLEVFWQNIDPTDDGGQFADRGHHYKTAIFVQDDEEQALAEESLAELEASGKFDQPIVTEILPFTAFYPAEEEHQAYADKNPTRYQLYKEGSGRGDFLRRTWGK